MKNAIISLTLATLATAAPTTYGEPAGGWENVDYSGVDYSNVDFDKVDYSGVDYSNIDWNKVDYSNVDWSKIDWSKVNYPEGTGDAPAAPQYQFFSRTWQIEGTPDEVVNGTGARTGGLPGSSATFWFGTRSDINLICYDITLRGFRGDYQSPAVTATHIHEGARDVSGPPRLAFPDPTGDGDERRSVGCMQGPFTVGVVNNGKDAAEGFHVSQLEQDPGRFYADIHSSEAVPGAMRGQLA